MGWRGIRPGLSGRGHADHVFVYGVLMSPTYLDELAPGSRLIGLAEAGGYRLEFDVVGFLVPCERPESAFGAVYDVPRRGIRVLDHFEGKSYERREILVNMADDSTVLAHAYVAAPHVAPILPGQPPADIYRELVVSGYRAHNAPDIAWERMHMAEDRARGLWAGNREAGI